MSSSRLLWNLQLLQKYRWLAFLRQRPACDRKLPFIMINSAEFVFLGTSQFILLSKSFNFEE